MKNILMSAIVALMFLAFDQSVYNNVSKTKIFKKEFKKGVNSMYDEFRDTELNSMFDLAFDGEDINSISEDIYQYQKLLKLENDLEVEKFINPKRKAKSWKAFMDTIGDNLKIIH